ncbi:hypothetical protein F2Q68_00038267 [Brassica cretica]|uniref:Uncharacterized protein n=1 Tax=Brassica cretica TaxID=69181 RepID=A0A8S9MAF3_BRACR|nr:hypothetical protein F2Q68_00038267 [Brassica cretica]
MIKRPLITHKFDQIDAAQRPRVVAPGGRSRALQNDDGERPRHVALGGRSGCWERPQVVAPRHRSGIVFALQDIEMASGLDTSLW